MLVFPFLFIWLASTLIGLSVSSGVAIRRHYRRKAFVAAVEAKYLAGKKQEDEYLQNLSMMSEADKEFFRRNEGLAHLKLEPENEIVDAEIVEDKPKGIKFPEIPPGIYTAEMIQNGALTKNREKQQAGNSKETRVVSLEKQNEIQAKNSQCRCPQCITQMSMEDAWNYKPEKHKTKLSHPVFTQKKFDAALHQTNGKITKSIVVPPEQLGRLPLECSWCGAGMFSGVYNDGIDYYSCANCQSEFAFRGGEWMRQQQTLPVITTRSTWG